MIQIGNSFDPVDRIRELLKNLRYISSIEPCSICEFDQCDFVTPFSIVPLSIVIQDKNLTTQGKNFYLDTIFFPEGQEVSNYTIDGATYFPITRADLSDLKYSEIEEKIRKLADKYVDLLQRNLGKDAQFVRRIGPDASHLLITEMLDNVSEHSNASDTYIFSQYWPKTESCEICLADNGIGIYQSLINANRSVDDNLDAIKNVIQKQLSAKDEFGSQHRGTGIKNTINLLLNNELKGFFCVISGTNGYFIDNTGRELYLSLENYFWKGTIVNMGFKKPKSKISIYDYIR